MKPHEWTAFIEGFTEENQDRLVMEIAEGAQDVERTPLGAQLFKDEWSKENKYLLIPFVDEPIWRSLDPFLDS